MSVEQLSRCFDEHGGPLFGFARRLCGPELAEEVVTHAFVTIGGEHRQEIPAGQSVRTTLLALSCERAAAICPTSTNPPPSQRLPEVRTEAAETDPAEARLIAATTSLPWDVRVALLTTSSSDQTRLDIARALRISPRELDERLAAGLRQLAALLRDESSSAESQPNW